MNELYPPIKDDDFRGDAYFTGKLKRDILLPTSPYSYSAQFHQGDELILREYDEEGFVILGVNGKRPTPTYESAELEFHIRRSEVEDLQPRKAAL